MQDIILLAKVEGAKRKKVVVDTPAAKVAWACSATNVWLKYNWPLNHMDNEAVVNLGLRDVEKYWKRIAQVVDELCNVQNFLPDLAMFVNEFLTNYNGRIKLEKRLRFRRNVNYEWLSTFFIQLHASIQ